MKIKSNMRKFIIGLSLMMTFTSHIPSYAADGDQDTDDEVTTINYRDIEDLVLENNLQLKSNEYTLKDMEDTLEDIEDARDEIRDMQRDIYRLSGSIGGPEGDPSMDGVINATKTSLNVAGGSLGANLPSTSDYKDQMKLVELKFELGEKQLVNSTQDLFILYHQVNDKLVQLERNSRLLTAQIDKAKISYQYGYALSTTVDDLEYKLEELTNNYNSLLQQKNLLILRFKNLVGLSSSDEVRLGNMPTLDKSFISEIDYESDLEEAIENSMNIKIKNRELRNADASNKRIKNEVKVIENQIDLALNDQYQLLIKEYNDLLLDGNNLNRLENEFVKAQVNLIAGNITNSTLDSLKNEIENQKSIIETKEADLFKEIEKYENIKTGMI